MLNDQKKLLAKLGALHAEARRLLDSGVKISGVVQNLRAARDELDTRVRFLEKEAAKARAIEPAAATPKSDD